jgi:hypothetical protein
MRYRLLIIVALFANVVAANHHIISNFETDGDFNNWRANISFKRVQEHVTEGQYSAKLETLSFKEGGEEWPSIATKNFPEDLSEYDTLSFDYFNATLHDPELLINLTDGNGARWIFRSLVLKENGGGSVKVKLPRIDHSYFDVTNVAELLFYFIRPHESVVLYIDNIKLEETSAARYKDLVDRWDNICETNAALLKEEDSNFERWKKIGKILDSAAPICERVSIIEQEINTLERDLEILLLRKKSKEHHPNTPFGIAWADSMVKVFPKDIPLDVEVRENYKIELAKNEYESCQFVIMAPSQDLYKVKVTTEKFYSQNGIPFNGEITVAPVGFVKTIIPEAFSVDYVGWYPDPILSFLEEIDINAFEIQPYWITVKSELNTVAGEYKGSFLIKAEVDGKWVQYRIPFSFEIWDFQLPKRRNLKTAVSVYDTHIMSANKVNDFIMRYGVNPGDLYRNTPPEISDLLRWKSQGMTAFTILNIYGKDNEGKFPASKKQAVLNTLEQYIPLLKENGLYELAYIYGFDEVTSEYYKAMNDICSAIKERYPDLPILTTAMDYTYGEKSGIDLIDAWCPLSNDYDLEAAERARERGKAVWWYFAYEPYPPHANVYLECPAIDLRLAMGIQAFHFKVDGFLYYTLNRWTNRTEPYAPATDAITSGPYTNWNPAVHRDRNGLGSLLCASPDEPLTTIRFENIRDGLDDYDYCWMLSDYMRKAEQKGGHEKLVQKATEALQFDAFIKSLRSFTRNPLQVRTWRKEIASLILQFQALGFN